MTRARYAPSPTGAIHLGNARTALLAWLDARASGGAFVMRVEDLDRARIVPGAEAALLDDLRWLGLDWDEGPDVGGPFAPYRQSERGARYDAAVDRLLAAGRAFPCACSRADVVRAASAPHDGDDDTPLPNPLPVGRGEGTGGGHAPLPVGRGEGTGGDHAGGEGPRYPGTCRGLPAAEVRARAAELGRLPVVRFDGRAEAVGFEDLVHGPVAADPRGIDDFVLRRADGTAAYQLAVVVDDAAMAVTRVVRGDDLLASTPRQIALYRALGLAEPGFGHVPLVLAPGGERLAKRTRPISVASLRAGGAAPEAVVGALAASAGLCRPGERATPARLARGFDIRTIRTDAVVIDPGAITGAP